MLLWYTLFHKKEYNIPMKTKIRETDTHIFLPTSLYQRVVGIANQEDDSIRHMMVILLREAVDSREDAGREDAGREERRAGRWIEDAV